MIPGEPPSPVPAYLLTEREVPVTETGHCACALPEPDDSAYPICFTCGKEVDDDTRRLPWGRGWSLSVGDLRAALAGVPDDYEVMLDNADVDDCEISEVRVEYLLPPERGSVGLLVLGGGQVVSHEYGYGPRLDAQTKAGAGAWREDHWTGSADPNNP